MPEIPVAVPVIDLAADDSDPGQEFVEPRSSSSSEEDPELAEARHEAALTRVRMLEARVRESRQSRGSRGSNASSGSGPSRPGTPVLPVATPPRSTRRSQRDIAPPSPVPETPSSDMRRAERREYRTELKKLQEERRALAQRSAEVERRAAALEAERKAWSASRDTASPDATHDAHTHHDIFVSPDGSGTQFDTPDSRVPGLVLPPPGLTGGQDRAGDADDERAVAQPPIFTPTPSVSPRVTPAPSPDKTAPDPGDPD